MRSEMEAREYLGDLWYEALAWADMDPDPQTRSALLSCLKSASVEDWDLVRSSFRPPLAFGTAGLRGELGFGPARFNVCLVARLAAALARWLQVKHLPGPVVIGFDARHKSEQAALAAAGQLAAFGFKVYVQPSPRPTPSLAFAARHLNASAALMVTASHNPSSDNGVKVYGPTARQIVPPTDKELAEILSAPVSLRSPSADFEILDDSVFEGYVRSCSALATSPRSARGGVRIVHTSMHGVALSALAPAFDSAGFSFVSVEAQALPDPDFPTTSFPNPEEPGSMDLVLDLAKRTSADLVLANDPDADRLAAAVPDQSGSYQILTGDELGAVFLWALLQRKKVGGVVASTIVSSELIGKICLDHGLRYQTTLTGFKWLSSVPELAFACEESIGYCLDPDNVRDKDGVSAAVFLADLVASGLDPLAVLETLDARYQAHVQANFSVKVSPEKSRKIIDRLYDGSLLGKLVSCPHISTEDLSKSSTTPTSGLRLRFASDSTSVRLIVRPSGTEPKTKLYIEVVHPSRSEATALAAAARIEVGECVS